MDTRRLYLTTLISNDLAHTWTVEEMANAVNLSPAHLHKLFRDQTGVAPIKYLQDLRLKKAREMLETSFLRIKQIGVNVGMPESGHLTKEFTKKYNISPTEYRKKYFNDKFTVPKISE